VGVQDAIPRPRVRLESQPAITRVREAVAEISKVAKKDPLLAAEGAIDFLERVSAALEQVTASSGAIGSAVYGAVAELASIIAAAEVDVPTANPLRKQDPREGASTLRLRAVVHVAGPPGVGKTTFIEALLQSEVALAPACAASTPQLAGQPRLSVEGASPRYVATSRRAIPPRPTTALGARRGQLFRRSILRMHPRKQTFQELLTNAGL